MKVELEIDTLPSVAWMCTPVTLGLVTVAPLMVTRTAGCMNRVRSALECIADALDRRAGYAECSP